MTRAAVSIAIGAAAATALTGLYLGIITLAQGSEHALEVLADDRVYVGIVSAAFGTQVGLFSYVRMLHLAMARGSAAVTGAGTATSSVSMVACCAHHLGDVLPIVGLSGLAVFLMDFRTPLMLFGIAAAIVGNALMIGELRRARHELRGVLEAAAGA